MCTGLDNNLSHPSESIIKIEYQSVSRNHSLDDYLPLIWSTNQSVIVIKRHVMLVPMAVIIDLQTLEAVDFWITA